MDPSRRKESRIRIARVDGNDELAEGLMVIDPSVPWQSLPLTAPVGQEKSFAFATFVFQMRCRLGLTDKKLAAIADVEIADLVSSESDPRHIPEVRTVYQLAGFFGVSNAKLMQVAGLAGPMDPTLRSECARFVKRCRGLSRREFSRGPALTTFVMALADDM